MSDHATPASGFHGPKCWLLSLAAGLALGGLLAGVLPAPAALADGRPDVAAYLAAPFVLLLLAIAVMPFIHAGFWGTHYPDFALALGGVTVCYYVAGLRGALPDGAVYGPQRMGHVALEYFQFIALIGSLYVVSGGVHIEIRGKATPAVNTCLLAVGGILANLFGTTGAAALLIRPYLRINKYRIRPFHVVLFIFIVANSGGCLTPIGDPPLFLGYLSGVPFFWTVQHLWPAWLLCMGLLLTVFYAKDHFAYVEHHRIHGPEPATAPERTSVAISGWRNFLFLGVVLFGVFTDRLLGVHAPVGAVLQIAAAAASHFLSKPEDLRANHFSFTPLKEVALLFIGIFATMVPALDYLQNNAAGLGIVSPSAFYWISGSLSSFLDNAPTYLTFFTAQHGLAGLEAGKQTAVWLALPDVGGTGYTAQQMLAAVSLGSVFFGANTYIGNGPNFMIKAIADGAGVPTPGFFGYIFRYTLPILIPIFVVVWLVCVR